MSFIPESQSPTTTDTTIISGLFGKGKSRRIRGYIPKVDRPKCTTIVIGIGEVTP